MAERAAKDQFEYSIATLPPTLRHRRLAFAVVVVTLAAYGAVLPFSGTPLPRIDSFIPTVMAIAFVTDLVTAVLLFGQFSATGSRALLMLASGYLFSSLVAHSIRSHLSGRVCADRPPRGRTSERRLAQCFHALRSCRWRRLGMRS